MKKMLAAISILVILVLVLSSFWEPDNGLVPLDQIATLEITYHNTPTITSTCDQVEQLRYLAKMMNRLEIRASGTPGNVRPEFELTFRDAQGQTVARIDIYNRYYLTAEGIGYYTDIPQGSESVHAYLTDLARGRDIPVQNPKIAMMFLGGLGILLFALLYGGICYLVQFLVCKRTGMVFLRFLPILGSLLLTLSYFLNNDFMYGLTPMFVMIAVAMSWTNQNILYCILLLSGLTGHVLGWQAGKNREATCPS